MKTKLLSLCLFGTVLLSGETLKHSMSMQGYTGLMNTPNAQVMNQGDITFQYNNQFDNHLRNYNYNSGNSNEDNYFFGAGVLPYTEVQGRLSEAPGYHRDLSANIKFQLPFKHKFFPTVAIGIQDLAGAASSYDNTYIVLDKEFWFLRASIGYGKAGDNEGRNIAKRLDGLFGGVEVRAMDWLYLLAENDSQENHVGARIHMPESWNSYFKLNALISSNITNNNEVSVAFNLTIPFNKASNPFTTDITNSSVMHSDNPYIYSENTTSSTKREAEKSLLLLEEELIALGFENIEIASNHTQLYISYENNIFLHNELDGIGVTLGLATKLTSKYKTFVIEPKKSKVVIRTIRGDLNAARNYYIKQDIASEKLFSSSLRISAPLTQFQKGHALTMKNDSSFVPRLEFSPVVKTFVGTEVGVFDYMLWLRGSLYMNLYKGIDISAVGDIAITNSDNFDQDTGAFRAYNTGSHLESLMIHNTDNISGSLNTLSAGIFKENFVGLMDQWIMVQGNHTFKAKVGYFDQFQDGNVIEEAQQGRIEQRTLALAKYTYLMEDYDMLGEVRFGQYWNQDQGFDVTLRRYFNDIAVAVTYQQVSNGIHDFGEETNHYAGISIHIPLTTKRSSIHKLGQLRGTNEFSYGIRTTVSRNDGTNRIVPGGALDPQMTFEPEKYFLNRNRLQLGYIQNNMPRLIQAYSLYGSRNN